MANMSSREIIKAVGGAALTTELAVEGAMAAAQTTAPAATPSAGSAAPPTTYLFFNRDEAAFIEAAVSRLIPADDQWPGALEAGVPNYIAKQAALAWGAGERLCGSGPWQPGTPSPPAELFRKALAAINKEFAQAGTPFATMSADQQDAYLHRLEASGKNLDSVPSEVFFADLSESTLEGFFSDPVYGGNRDMVAWRMIGFPGAYASHYDLVDQHGVKIDRPPMSALTYWALDAIKKTYLKSPGPLVRA